MDAALNPANAMALFIGLVVLAAVPSTSVLIVAARAASAGFRHGALAALGIVVGDVIFITIAIFGLVFLAAALGPWFVVVKALAGGYLLWLGLRTWTSASASSGASGRADPSRRSSFLAGLLFTLGDQKAILFYFGFFPAFIELDRLSGFDAALIMLIAVVAVGGVKLAYAWAAERAVRIAGSQAGAWLAGACRRAHDCRGRLPVDLRGARVGAVMAGCAAMAPRGAAVPPGLPIVVVLAARAGVLQTAPKGPIFTT